MFHARAPHEAYDQNHSQLGSAFRFRSSTPASGNLSRKPLQGGQGQSVEAFDPGSNTTTGTLSDGGWLNGTTVVVFNSGAFPTPIPTEVTFTSTFTLTTNHGQLSGSRIYLFDLVTGQGTTMVRIDPTTSTGVFAGATGVLFFGLIKSTTVAVGPYYEVVSGQICFADGSEPPEG